MSGASEDHREQICKEIRLLDDRISTEETELFERRVEMEELSEGRGTRVEDPRCCLE